MTNEIVAKIEKISLTEISARGRTLSLSPLSESEVQHLFTLTRKLIEKVPDKDLSKYALIKFYCDWTLHSEIDRSKAGAKIIMKVHDIIIDHLKKKDNSAFARDITNAFSLEDARRELNALVSWHGGKSEVFSKDTWNTEIIPTLAEIITHTPIKIGDSSKLEKILEAIKLKPIKGSSIVEEIALIKVPSWTFKPSAPQNEITFCVQITTTDTTKFITPLIKYR